LLTKYEEKEGNNLEVKRFFYAFMFERLEEEPMDVVFPNKRKKVPGFFLFKGILMEASQIIDGTRKEDGGCFAAREKGKRGEDGEKKERKRPRQSPFNYIFRWTGWRFKVKLLF